MVYMLFADGFEEVEALTPCDYLRRAEIEVTLVSMNRDTVVTGAHGIRVICDMTADEALRTIGGRTFEMLILPGGKGGVEHLDADSRTESFLTAAQNSGAVIAAICAGPSILGKRNLLQGKQAICYPGFESYLAGAAISSSAVVSDGKTVTAKAAGVASEFSFCLIGKLKGEAAAEKVRTAVYFEK